MNQYPGWKNALIAFFLLISTLYALPNIFGSDLAVQVSSAGDNAIGQSDLNRIENILKGDGISYKSIGLSNRRILARFDDNSAQLSAKKITKGRSGS